jgi:hypothetical protein
MEEQARLDDLEDLARQRFVSNLGGNPKKHLEQRFNSYEMIFIVYWRKLP